MNARLVILKLIAAMHDRGMVLNELPATPMVVMCVRWPGGVVGNRQKQCAICKCLIAVSPDTWEMMAKRGHIDILHCLICAAKAVEKEGFSVVNPEVTH